MAERIQTLPGFRDFYPEDCAVRNYVFAHWRAVARGYGFHEYEGPALESTDLYRKKSGAEIVGQLFHFTDKGGREVALRPELTPTLARMAAARQRHYKKPMKWFGVGRFFRYEKQQRGRLREFYQLNCDILGEASIAADAELVAMAIDLMRALGFSADDFFIRVSDRNVWLDFLATQGIAAERAGDFLAVIDKLDRERPEATEEKLAGLGTSRAAVDAFIADSGAADSAHFRPLFDALAARGMDGFARVDLGIVRGLAYYTGVVFEVFDRGAKNRAVAGGGRYDKLCALVSDGEADMPACGFAMGDVVIADFINATAAPKQQLLEHLSTAGAVEVFVIVADEARRADALAAVQRLRMEGHRVDFALAPAKVGKQFHAAEALKARAAVIIGGEFPVVRVKDLARRVECEVDATTMLAKVREILGSDPGDGPLLA